MKKWPWWIKTLIVLAVVFGLIQLIPYGRNHTNPAVILEPKWDNTTTKALVTRTCYDCHSNETTWPWYSNIAPASWLIQHDVDEARLYLNFSEWSSDPTASQELMGAAVQAINSGKMPPLQFLILHPDAKLTDAEKLQLIQGLQNSGK
jgi:mono/diheme cytochrome c family protein